MRFGLGRGGSLALGGAAMAQETARRKSERCCHLAWIGVADSPKRLSLPSTRPRVRKAWRAAGSRGPARYPESTPKVGRWMPRGACDLDGVQVLIGAVSWVSRCDSDLGSPCRAGVNADELLLVLDRLFGPCRRGQRTERTSAFRTFFATSECAGRCRCHGRPRQRAWRSIAILYKN